MAHGRLMASLVLVQLLTFLVAAQEADSKPGLTPAPPTLVPSTPIPSTTVAPATPYQPRMTVPGVMPVVPAAPGGMPVVPGTASGMPVMPPPPGFAPSVVPTFPRAAPLGITPPTIIPPQTIAPQPRTAAKQNEHFIVPAKIEFNDGTTLTGEIHSDSQLESLALFGPAAIPFNQIKGLEWRNQTNDQGDNERRATIVLKNADSLTVTTTTPQIHVKTSWGEALIDLTQARSIVMTNEKVKWADTPTGRMLVPEDDKQ